VPYHWGSVGLVQGDVVNDLFPLVGDPSVHIPESKVATCDVVRGKRARHLPLDASSPALPRRDRPGIGQPSAEPKQVKEPKH